MATPLEDAELLILNLDRGMKEIKQMYESKQGDRLLSNHVWIADQVNNKIKKHIAPLKDLLASIKRGHLGDFKSATNFDIAIKHCGDINNVVEEILVLYGMRANHLDIKLRWQYSFPRLQENMNHLRNRFGIIRGQITRKSFEYEEEDNWF